MSANEELSATIGEATLEPSTTSLVSSAEDPGRTIANCTCRRLELTGLLSLRQWTKVEIEWLDAYELTGDHNLQKKILKEKQKCIVKTIGYVVYVDDDQIALTNVDLRKARHDGGRDGGFVSVKPIGMIQGYKKLS